MLTVEGEPVSMMTTTSCPGSSQIITVAVVEDLVRFADELISRLFLRRVWRVCHGHWLEYVRSSCTPSHDCGAPLDYGMLESAQLDEHPFMPLALTDMEICFGSLRAVIQVPTQLVSDTVAAKRP